MAGTAYENCLTAMYGLRRFGIKLGLETIRHILSHLGDPQLGFRSIHIAGTNGKGSVAAMLSTILHAAGYRVGRYTSPHLERFNERICINNAPIADADVIAGYNRVADIKQVTTVSPTSNIWIGNPLFLSLQRPWHCMNLVGKRSIGRLLRQVWGGVWMQPTS
jgi:folylpolyglutamate synthase/dihydropteroate synthase